MFRGRFTRRRFLNGMMLTAPGVLAGWSGLVEPGWIVQKTIRFCEGEPKHRLVHFTDLHYKGNEAFLRRLVGKINSLHADFVLFTGDVIEESRHLRGAVAELREIQAPLVGVPGNHDYWARIDFSLLQRCFAATGGAWLMGAQWRSADGAWTVTGETCMGAPGKTPLPAPDTRNLLLIHYPSWVKKMRLRSYDLVLAGHSHGGQVRLPFVGALVLPFGVDEYDKGLFSSPAGPLYVNPGIGWFHLPFRFLCRPEITIFEF